MFAGLVEVKDISSNCTRTLRTTDGRNSLKEMAWCQRVRLKYIRLLMERFLSAESRRRLGSAMMQQMEEIDRWNELLKEIAILKGIEVENLEDESLDLDDMAPAWLELVVGTVHSLLQLLAAKTDEAHPRAMDDRYDSMRPISLADASTSASHIGSIWHASSTSHTRSAPELNSNPWRRTFMILTGWPRKRSRPVPVNSERPQRQRS